MRPDPAVLNETDPHRSGTLQKKVVKCLWDFTQDKKKVLFNPPNILIDMLITLVSILPVKKVYSFNVISN